MALGITHQGDLVPLLNDGVTIRACQNAVAADPLHVAAGVGIDAGFAQGAATYPGGQLGADPVGANDGQIGLAALAVGESPLAGYLLRLGIEVESCQGGEVAHHQHQPHQAHQVGQGVAYPHVVEHGLHVGAVGQVEQAAAQGILGPHQRRGRGERPRQYPRRHAGPQVEELGQSHRQQQGGQQDHQGQGDVVDAVAQEDAEEVRASLDPHTENEQHEADVLGRGGELEPHLAKQQGGEQHPYGVANLEVADAHLAQQQAEGQYHEQQQGVALM
ncbi:hypothetical protein D3C84_450380 [compost metagenome]